MHYLSPCFLFKLIHHTNFQKEKYGKKHVPIIKIRFHNYGIIWGNKTYVINSTEIGILCKLQKPNLQAFPMKNLNKNLNFKNTQSRHKRNFYLHNYNSQLCLQLWSSRRMCILSVGMCLRNRFRGNLVLSFYITPVFPLWGIYYKKITLNLRQKYLYN